MRFKFAFDLNKWNEHFDFTYLPEQSNAGRVTSGSHAKNIGGASSSKFGTGKSGGKSVQYNADLDDSEVRRDRDEERRQMSKEIDELLHR